MSKIGYFWRYSKMVHKVRQQPYISKSDLMAYLEKGLEHAHALDDTMTLGISARTIERDFREIRNLIGISIEYSHARRGYYIEEENTFGEMALMRMLESFDLYQSLNIAQDIDRIAFPEKERPQGLEHLCGLIHAIE